MLMQCECQHWNNDKSEACVACGRPNPKLAGPRQVKRVISDVLWCLMFVAGIIYFALYMMLLGKAENAIQQVFAAADTMAWAVLSYVIVRSLTSVLRK